MTSPSPSRPVHLRIARLLSQLGRAILPERVVFKRGTVVSTSRVPIRSFKYRVRPNKAQASLLDEMLLDFCGLYNAGLQQRIEAYRRRGKTLRCFDQTSELKAVREAEPNLARWSFTALQQVLRRLDQTYT